VSADVYPKRFVGRLWAALFCVEVAATPIKHDHRRQRILVRLKQLADVFVTTKIERLFLVGSPSYELSAKE
jgi:hypothetical protein